ncbi:hypothetical protein IWX90DRAFT_101105 [Phyllosticta citrichinensis]|uniref:Uncharacterized protein n=1 Tax=Phyllosticta citrichinensis TaxID=1130410 RepID=A0ABR1Y1V0_9PEZI
MAVSRSFHARAAGYLWPSGSCDDGSYAQFMHEVKDVVRHFLRHRACSCAVISAQVRTWQQMTGDSQQATGERMRGNVSGTGRLIHHLPTFAEPLRLMCFCRVHSCPLDIAGLPESRTPLVHGHLLLVLLAPRPDDHTVETPLLRCYEALIGKTLVLPSWAPPVEVSCWVQLHLLRVSWLVRSTSLSWSHLTAVCVHHGGQANLGDIQNEAADSTALPVGRSLEVINDGYAARDSRLFVSSMGIQTCFTQRRMAAIGSVMPMTAVRLFQARDESGTIAVINFSNIRPFPSPQGFPWEKLLFSLAIVAKSADCLFLQCHALPRPYSAITIIILTPPISCTGRHGRISHSNHLCGAVRQPKRGHMPLPFMTLSAK